jgi:hypothetical protein
MLLEALMYTTRKYWNCQNQFIILGYTHPDFEFDKNWSFVSLGEDTGPSNWANDLLKYFSKFEDKYFINMIDDTLLTRQCDIEKMNRAFNYMKNNEKVKKIFLHGSMSIGGKDLFGDISFSPVQDLNKEFYDVSETANYRSSIQSSIWNTQYFLSLLKPNMNPWDFELQFPKNDGARILTTLQNHPTMISHLCDRGVIIENWYVSMYENSQLTQEDISNVEKIKNK